VHSPSRTHITNNQLNRCLLIAQDRQEIFLIFAEYSEAYARYVKGINKTTTDFLHVKGYGPWNVMGAGAVKRLAGIILGFVHRARDGL
jgi:hypothetical protein